MAMRAIIISLLLCGVAAKPSAALTNSKLSPIQKVVTLVTEMKAQTIKEGEQDLEAFDKYKCWCETTTSEKTAAIKAAEDKISELSSFVEEAAAKEGELKTEIAGLEEDIAADTEALATATAMRNEQNAEFQTEEADMKETIGLLGEATATLSKVNLMQKPQKAEALVQVQNIVRRVSPKFGSVMQKDLFDMLGEFKGMNHEESMDSKVATGSFLGEVFLGKQEAAALAQQRPQGETWDGDAARGLKSEEQLGKESKANGEQGAAAGAKSYNSRSGGILGLLNQMAEEFATKLAAATKEENAALASFDKLAAAKTGEISSANQQKDAKSTELADLMDKAAKAKEDIEATTNALSADEAFLAETTKGCATEDKLYAERTATRNDEITALGETLDILTGDEARSLFDKTISFLQVDSATSATMMAAKNKAFQRILAVSKKTKNWMLASLAVRVKLDAFTKVKKAMDTMLNELASQQKTEYAKWETCKADIDTNEDKIWDGKVVQRDLNTKHKDLVNTIAMTTKNIEDLTNEVADSEVSLKQAGEQRKAENQLFQQTINDQRAMITILHMAMDRLKDFYEPKAVLVQVHAHANPPPKPSGPEAVGYKKSGSSGGVMQLLSMIIEDAGRTDGEMHADEQQAQADYGDYVAVTTNSINANRKAIAEKEKQLASSDGEKSETEQSQLANDESLAGLAELLSGIHNQCDYVIKYFDIRQTSRAEEMDAIKEAKAILSGASFA